MTPNERNTLRQELQEAKKNKFSYMNASHCLIAGTGEAGKSTFIKQMQLIYENKYHKKADRRSFTSEIRRSIHRQLDWAKAKVRVNLSRLTCQEKKDKISKLSSSENYPFWRLDNEEREQIIRYKDEVKFVWNGYREEEELNMGQYQKTDNIDYFVKDRFDTVCETDYVPSITDLLRHRRPTTQVKQHQIEVSKFLGANKRFVFYDLGGQRTHRDQWIELMQDEENKKARFILFFASLADFNEQMEEDETVNRLDESVRLFRHLVEYKGNAKKKFVLMLNKMDLFERKLIKEEIKLSDYFAEYTDSNTDVEKAKQFIDEQLFRKGYENRFIQTQFTTATNSDNIRNVFEDIAYSDFFDC